MEQLPGWLEAAVYAAGVTAYADEVERVPLNPDSHLVGPSSPPSNDEMYH